MKDHVLYDFIYVKYLETDPWKQKIDQWLSGIGRQGEERVIPAGDGAFFWHNKNVLEMGSGGQPHEQTKVY